MPFSRLILAGIASLLGAGGVVLAAAGAHSGGNELARTASLFLIIHAAALLGVAASSNRDQFSGSTILAGYGLAIGVLLFSLDLTFRAFAGSRIFPFAAPFGGLLMIGSWLFLAAAYFVAAFRSPKD